MHCHFQNLNHSYGSIHCGHLRVCTSWLLLPSKYIVYWSNQLSITIQSFTMLWNTTLTHFFAGVVEPKCDLKHEMYATTTTCTASPAEKHLQKAIQFQMTSNKNDDGPAKAFDRMSMLITSNKYHVSWNNWKMATSVTHNHGSDENGGEGGWRNCAHLGVWTRLNIFVTPLV